MGSRKWDLDGHEYVDYAGGHGALLLGHNHPAVTAAVERQLRLGTHFGACHEAEIRWGALVQELIPSAERVRFTSSGTEATLMALRLARAYTGRSKVLRFLGHFHGWHDHVAFGVGSHFDGSPTPGVLPDIAREILLAPANDFAATQAALDAHPDLAAVIIEPTGASWGQAPVLVGFLHALREWTEKRGIVLIFDEVISGFRVSPGGAQAEFGIKPDLTTLAKIIAGGFPGGALAGRKPVMDCLDGAASAAAGREKVPHHGTFNANPISAAAGIAALTVVRDTDACSRANDYAARLREALARAIQDERLPWLVYGTFSGFHIFTNPNGLDLKASDIEQAKAPLEVLKSQAGTKTPAALRMGMLCQGVDLFAWPGGPTSSVHTDEDLEITSKAFRETLRVLKREGLA